MARKSSRFLPEKSMLAMEIERKNTQIANKFEEELRELIEKYNALGITHMNLMHRMRYLYGCCESGYL